MSPRRKKIISPDTKVLLKRIFTGVLVMGVVALLITGVWHGTRTEMLTINTVQVSGGETIPHSQIEDLVREKLQGQYLGLVPREFAWLYPETEIRQSLEDIERVHDVAVEKISGTEIRVTFDEHVPAALWCESVDSEECLFIDTTGYAFGQAPKLSGGSFLRFSKVGESTALHEPISSAEDVASLFALSDLLAEQGWFVSHVEIGQSGDAFLQLVDGGEFKVTLTQTPQKTVENLFVILTSEDFKHVAPGNFQYIDLRYGNKVFVNEELVAPETGTTSSTSASDEVE